ncbi:hypothetical protein Rhopal_006238-T1 [Rhodotorula paludigena]|uniref:Uncharacterized protein n=1 Tax=Rhodotorula paludigena TaxID=86838 RepID=A0AAV5GUK5_9BASI|nr:hypothetical protein Rhopal_006238-T1 [Rhodotorula paludigena]
MAGGAVVSGARATGPKLSKRQEIFAFCLVTSLFFAWGLSYGLLDVLNKKAQEAFKVTRLMSTMLQVAYFGAYIVYSVPASMFASRFGYKAGILMGLALYSIGAIAFWPSAHYAKYYGFVISSFVIACGLATLETMANSYIAVLGSPERAAFRLNLAQSSNGVGAFIGPLIASKTFFTGANAHSLKAVQYTYLAVACFGAALAVLFFFAKLPEISEASIEEDQDASGVVDERPLWRRKHTVFGFISQFFYVTTASFIVNYMADGKLGYSSAKGAEMLMWMQITFMLARIVSTPLLRFFNPAIILSIYGLICTVFSLVAALTDGKAGLAALFLVFFGEAVIYPTTFTLATSNLGKYSKRGAGLLVMGVGGGAAFPPMQGALADAKGTTLSYVIPFAGFSITVAYGIGMFFYTRRIERQKADAALFAQGPATLAHPSDSELEKTESADKGEVDQIERVRA